MPILLAVSPLAAMRSAPVTMAPTFAGFEKVADHVVGDERERNAAFVEFPRGEARALQIGARFRDEDVELFALLDGDAEYAERGADAAGGESAGVALRHDLAVGGHEFRAEAADGFVGGFLFEMNLLGFFDHRCANFREVGSLRDEVGELRFMRSMAQKRSTAVGRVFARTAQISANSGRSSSTEFALECRTPSAAPMAAATPMAGAPRMTMSRMALATSW